MKSPFVVKPPTPVRILLHFANARPTERTWRRVLLQPFRKVFSDINLDRIPEAPTFGVSNLAECDALVDDLRVALAPMVAFKGPISRRAMDEVAVRLSSEARLQLVRFRWNNGRRRLEPVWATKEGTAREMLYSFLLLALQEVSPRSLHRCAHCAKYFFDPSERPKSYCSARCRTIDGSLRFQRRHRSKYRLYHRELVRRIRNEE